jgi:hypothetical protein
VTETAPAAHVLVVTSAGAASAAVVPVLAAIEAAGMRVRAIDVGGAGGGGAGVADRVRRALLGETAERRLRRELDANPPDVAVAFDPHAALALTVARDQAASPAPVIAVIADLDPVSEWRQTDADRFLCVDDVAAVALAELGVEAERTLVVGPIGERAFADTVLEDRASVRGRFKLGGVPVVIDVAGLGAEAVGQLVLQLSLVKDADRMHFLFDAAGDAEVAAVLRRQVPALQLRGKLFGATPDAPQLWRAAEVVVARPRPAVIARVLLTGARLVAINDDSIAGGARIVAALEARKRAVGVRNLLLVSGAIEAALGAGAPPKALPDGADTAADVIAVVAGDKRGVIDERRAAARAATHDRVRAASAAVGAAARVTAMPGELEDLGGGGDDLEDLSAAIPDDAELGRLRTEVKQRIAELTRSMMASRDDAERFGKEAEAARGAGREADASAASRKADAERSRMHALLGELATLERELAELEKAAAAPRPTPPKAAQRPPASETPPRPTASAPPRSSLDDELARLKRSAGGASSSAPPRTPPPSASAPKSGVDDELAALKQKMQQAKKKP